MAYFYTFPLVFWQPLQQSTELIYHLAHYDLLGMQTMQEKTKATVVCQHYLKACHKKSQPPK
ncbi:hypothetical protein ACTXMH_03410 [Psychrobacter celer]|uniref:hypothetical protein n=1 Tax=Psychrobacter TaxID=497 RepID=UPI000946D1BD|nr:MULTISPECIES: hypothetical protein [unclassified Psychrobacter]OLF40773.1 hypothetical protein BTV99_07030 [Psychrobacter sp. Rd 27.2]PJX23168.1 hypothetical protein CAP50_08800 [Psychrobacter sp. L7]